MIEIWKPVFNFEGIYEVSSFGNIRSIASENSRHSGKILSPGKGKYGHCMVQLYKDGKKHRKLVHRLVALNFISDQPKDCEVNHIDFNPTNNHVSNLEWVTHRKNILHSRDRLANFKGIDHGGAKLSNEDILKIREEYANGGISHKNLGDKYGICAQQCHRIVTKQRWKHI